MRFHSLVLALATAIGVAACGSSNNSDTSSDGQYSSLPPIEVGDPSPVSIVDGEFLNAFATADDTANNRWLVADHVQGIIAVDKTTDERSVIAPIAADDNNSVFTTIDDIALDVATGTLYILDTSAGQIVTLDTDTGESSIAVIFEDVSIDDNYILRSPTSLFFDGANNRLLIADSYGLTYTSPTNPEASSLGLAVFVLTPADNSLSVLAADANLADPLAISYEMRDLFFDPEENNLYLSGFLHANTPPTGQHIYVGLRINAETWEKVVFYEESVSFDNAEISRRETLRSNAYNAITYDSSSDSAFLFNQYQQALFAIDVSNIDNEDPDLISRPTVAITFPSDEKDYNLRLGSELYWNNEQLYLFDPNLRGYFAVNTEDFTSEERPEALGERELIFSGAPIYQDRLSAPQQTRQLSYSPAAQALVITDWSSDQRNALIKTTDGYAALPIEVDMTGITPVDTTFPADEEAPEPPIFNTPKPAFIAFDHSTGDTIFVGHAYSTATEDPYLWHSYYFAIYLQKAGEDSFKPISTYVDKNDDNKVKLVDFTSTSLPFALSAVGNMTATSQTTYLSIGSSVFFWENSEKSGILDSASNAYNPTDITGIALDASKSQIVVSDRFHSSIIAIDQEPEGGEDDDIREINVVSGPEQAGNFLRLPQGLAIDTASNTGYTFENESRSIIAIDLVTGERTRIESTPNYLRNVSTLTISDDGQTLYILDKTINRLMVMDIASGNQQWLDSIE